MQNMRNDTITRKLNSLFLCSVLLMSVGITTLGMVSAENTQWTATIHCDESSGKQTHVVVGEATDALDGQDSYDAPVPPPGFPPILTLYIETDFPYPRDTLMRELRHYPGEGQVWKLVVSWSGDETTVTLSWNPQELQQGEYTSILLNSSTEEDPLLDMLAQDTYSFTLTAGVAHTFYMICSEPSLDEEPDEPPEDNQDQTEPDDQNDTNQPPNADASGSQTEGYVDTPVQFDGSLSTDEDGTITQWQWDFGDGSMGTGKQVTHSFTEPGLFIVTLTVTDDKNENDSDVIFLHILENNVSIMQPYLQGPGKGTKNTSYSFNLWTTASANDRIFYTITWGDGTNTTTSSQPSGEILTVNHSWDTPGIYQITAKAHINQSTSNQTSSIILIDTIILENLGWLIDENADQLYDLFKNEDTGLTTYLMMHNQSVYLIDTNGDGTWDYSYDASSGLLQTYKEDDSSSETATPANYLGCLIILLCVLAFVIHRRNHRKR
jgi:hypothetical protein